MKKKNFMR